MQAQFVRAHPLLDDSALVDEHSGAKLGTHDDGDDVDDDDDHEYASPLDYRSAGHAPPLFSCWNCCATFSISLWCQGGLRVAAKLDSKNRSTKLCLNLS